MRVRLIDLEEVSPNKFQPDEHVLSVHCGTPAYRDSANDTIKVDDEFYLVGWCRNMHARNMFGREGQIGLLLFSDEFGTVWQHYPIYDDYDSHNFEVKAVL